jgi:hypothetical protein
MPYQSIMKRIDHCEMKQRRFSMLMSKVINSGIISSIPSPFDKFEGKRYTLFYRRNPDGFDSVNKHCCVDGHSHTLTLIETRKGYIFGGYMDCCNDSSDSWKGDDSLKRFVVTLQNPHNLSPHKFPLKSELSEYAMQCHSSSRIMWFGKYAVIGAYMHWLPRRVWLQDPREVKKFRWFALPRGLPFGRHSAPVSRWEIPVGRPIE